MSAETRRIERPGPPALPHGWRELGQYTWQYDSERVVGAATDMGSVALGQRGGGWLPLVEELALKQEVAQATLDILTYLRARYAYYSQTRVVTHPGLSPQAEAVTGAVSVDDARPEEPSHVDGGA